VKSRAFSESPRRHQGPPRSASSPCDLLSIITGRALLLDVPTQSDDKIYAWEAEVLSGNRELHSHRFNSEDVRVTEGLVEIRMSAHEGTEIIILGPR
jgi:hypothetical protein